MSNDTASLNSLYPFSFSYCALISNAACSNKAGIAETVDIAALSKLGRDT